MDKVKYIKDSIEIKQKILSDKDFLLQIDNVAEKIIKCYRSFYSRTKSQQWL